MVDIQIPDGRPEVNVTDGLKTELSYFRVDQEALVAGLEIAEWPPAAIDSLKVDFALPKSKQAPVVGSVYDEDTHRFGVSVGVPRERAVGLGAWEMNHDDRRANRYVSNLLNYTLARQAQRAADTINHTDDAAELMRAIDANPLPVDRRVRILAGSLVPASATGAELGYNVSPNAAGIIGGALVGSLVDLVGVALYFVWREDHNRDDRSWADRVDVLSKRLEQRAADFAQRPEVHEIFKSVISVDLRSANGSSAATTEIKEAGPEDAPSESAPV